MISRLFGTLLAVDAGSVEVRTASGLAYELEVPTTVLQRLPPPGEHVEFRTVHVVREDSAALYGFLSADERTLFQRLLSASGVGPRLAIAMMSAYVAPRLARALVEKDVAALCQVAGVGRKTAERLALELADKVADLAGADATGPGGGAPGVQEAVAALVALGYDLASADRAVRAVIAEGGVGDADGLIRRALSLHQSSP